VQAPEPADLVVYITDHGSLITLRTISQLTIMIVT
jgi:hypothetical protein